MSLIPLALSLLFPFLRSKPPLEQERIERILLVCSGSWQNCERAAHGMAVRFPGARLALLAADPGAQPQKRLNAPLSVLPFRGLRRARADAARAQYDLKVVLFTGEGQTRLKLLSFLLPARRTLVFTEGGGTFAWSFDERLAIWNHIRWRLGGGRPLLATLKRLGRAANPVLSFVAFVWLLVWHARLLALRTARRGRRG